MRYSLLGHACVRVVSDSGDTLIIDPFDSGGLGGKFDLPPISTPADFVVCSHEHGDHNAVSAVPGSPKRVESGTAGAFSITRHPVFHDEYEGERFGGRCDVIEVEVDGKRLLHLSDVGESWTGLNVGAVDVLFVPVGGYFTIGALQAVEWIRMLAPTSVVPIHFADPKIDLPLHDLAFFEKHWR